MDFEQWKERKGNNLLQLAFNADKTLTYFEGSRRSDEYTRLSNDSDQRWDALHKDAMLSDIPLRTLDDWITERAKKNVL